MKECSKSLVRRLGDSRFVRNYFVGEGIDIGGAPDPLELYQHLFPLCRNITTWDIDDGDAQYMNSVSDNIFDFVHSSHCLEHLDDPFAGIANWMRILKPGGHLVVTIPDEDLYEQGVFPSRFNKDHKWTFTINKKDSWSAKSISIFRLIDSISGACKVLKVELLNTTYDYNIVNYDQTLTPVSECGIELILRKTAGYLPEATARYVHNESLCRHYNQYREDIEIIKRANRDKLPFQNTSPLFVRK